MSAWHVSARHVDLHDLGVRLVGGARQGRVRGRVGMA